jgi:hypothetical protein
MRKTTKVIALTVLATTMFWVAVLWCVFHLTANPNNHAVAAEPITNRFALMVVQDARDVSKQRFTLSVRESGNTPTNFVATNNATLVRSLHDGQEFSIAVHETSKATSQ